MLDGRLGGRRYRQLVRGEEKERGKKKKERKKNSIVSKHTQSTGDASLSSLIYTGSLLTGRFCQGWQKEKGEEKKEREEEEMRSISLCTIVYTSTEHVYVEGLQLPPAFIQRSPKTLPNRGNSVQMAINVHCFAFTVNNSDRLNLAVINKVCFFTSNRE